MLNTDSHMGLSTRPLPIRYNNNNRDIVGPLFAKVSQIKNTEEDLDGTAQLGLDSGVEQHTK